MLQLLMTIKFIIFTSITKVEHNRLPVIILSSIIAIFILSLISKSEWESKRKDILGLSIYSLISILLLVDSTYFSQFNSLTSLALLKQVSQLSSIVDSIKALINLQIILLVIDLPLLFFLSKKNPGLIINNKASSLKFLKEPMVVGLILLGLILFYNMNGQIKSIEGQEFFTYHFIDLKKNIYKTLELENRIESEAAAVFAAEDLEELRLRAKLEKGKLTGIGKGKNLIVLQVEALQNFAINLVYEGQEITPNLNRLIGDPSSVYYNNYYQLLGRGNTSDAEFVSQNSLHPSMDEPTYLKYANNTFYGLPWLLRDNNYTAWVFHGYEKTYWNREQAYINQGFQKFISQEDFEFEDSIGFGIKDEDFFPQSVEYLKELDVIDDNPFYAFMISLTSHTPFNMPEEYQALNIRREHKDTILGNYLQAIHYTDKQMGIFLDKLKEEGLYEDTVIALYGDHFAVLSTQKQEQKIMSEFLGANYDFHQMMNVPLIVHVPGKEINEIISTTGSQLDFYPTISNIMGYENYKGLVFGRDLTNYKDKNYVYPQTYMLKGSIIDDESVFEMSRDGLYDHSRAYKIKTGESIDVDVFRDQHYNAISEIDKSNYILENNLLKDLVEKSPALTEKNMYLVAHAGGGINGMTYTNSKAALDNSYKNGIRLMELDFEWTNDGQLVVLHSWDGFVNKFFNVDVKRYYYDEFEKFTMVNGYTHLTPDRMAKWMEDHPDAYIVTDIKRDNIKGLGYLRFTYPHLVDRIIPQIYRQDEYETVKELGYENIILTLYMMGNKNQVLDFMYLDELLAVTMPQVTASTDLPLRLSERGVYVYTHTINDLNELLNLKNNGVKGFYTDYLVP